MGCRGAAPARAEADRPQGSAGGNGVALWGAETASPAELPRAGILPYRLGHVPGLRPSAGALDTEEIGLAEHDQRDQRGDLGADQSPPVAAGQDGQARERRDAAGRQHGDGCPGAPANRQQFAVGQRTYDGALVRGGRRSAGRARLAQSQPSGQEAQPVDPVLPLCRQTQKAVPGSAQGDPRHPGLCGRRHGEIDCRAPGRHQGSKPGSPRCASTGP